MAHKFNVGTLVRLKRLPVEGSRTGGSTRSFASCRPMLMACPATASKTRLGTNALYAKARLKRLSLARAGRRYRDGDGFADQRV